MVINGVEAFNCSMAVPARPVECHQVREKDLPSVFGNDLINTRLRIVNVG
jgi:hypothetical protein